MSFDLIPLQSANDDLIDACGNDPGQICEWVYDASGNATLSSIIGWAVDKPLTILIVLLVAFVGSRIVKRAIVHFGERLTAERKTEHLHNYKRLKELKRLQTKFEPAMSFRASNRN